jgi:hypothetical protein
MTEAGNPAPTAKELTERLSMLKEIRNRVTKIVDEGISKYAKLPIAGNRIKEIEVLIETLNRVKDSTWMTAEDLDSLASESEREQGALKAKVISEKEAVAVMHELPEARKLRAEKYRDMEMYQAGAEDMADKVLEIIDRLSPKAGGTGKEGE